MTKKSARLINEVSKENVKTEWSKFRILVDSSTIYKNFQDKSKLIITEIITTKKYDKNTGAVTEETTTERKIAQDTDKVVTETEEKGVTEKNDILVNEDSDFSKILDSEEKLESEGGQESFGKWFGIVSACFIGLFLLYLWRKFRVS